MDGSAKLSDAGITSREAEVLRSLGDRLTNAEIAARFHISVRTVESHVSSLLRKLGVTDRRGLADLAASLDDGPPEPDADPVGAALPVPLTSFVGRTAEVAELADAVDRHRLVTALGPGGVGKTRLAVAVASRARDDRLDAVWFVDLVPVTDPAMVAAAVAATLGVGERQGCTVEEAVTLRLARAEALLVLDNCEHLLDGVAVFVERLLSACPGVRVLATSRARLVLPFEQVFPVPGLSMPDEATGGGGDAVALFVERASAAGPFTPSPAERARIAEICGRLDGMALAIELAAARLPTLGLDGVEAGLGERLRLLSGGRRADQRHGSLRSAIEWSDALLTPVEQALWRRVTVFAAPFTAEAAVAVVGFPPVAPGSVADGLARLADHSLLVTSTGAETRYRALETLRQYAEEGLGDPGGPGELGVVRARHRQWCLDTAASLVAGSGATFDRLADEVRAALGLVGDDPAARADGHRLANLLAELTFDRGRPAEAQRRYEQAAALAADATAEATAVRLAAGAAASRHFGNDALRLWRRAADVALAAGDDRAAAHDLALAAGLISRASGLITELPPDGTAHALIAEAEALAGDDAAAGAAILTARAFALEEGDPAALELAERAVELARAAGDRLVESSALDMITAAHLAQGDIVAAVADITRRTGLLASVRSEAVAGLELSDGYAMASEVCLAAGDIPSARRFAAQMAALPFYREEGHLATSRAIKVDALAGDFAAVLRDGERFREGWEQAGRPATGNLAGAAYAVATVHGLCGDDDARAEWLAIADTLSPHLFRHQGCASGYAPIYDAVLALHRGEHAAALERLEDDPEDMRSWYTGEWRPWYAALWAEAAVLADDPTAGERLVRARPIAAPNPIATTMLDRAAALAAGDLHAVPALVAALERAACPYQAARTLVLAGGDHERAGQAALAGLGATPAAVIPVRS